MVKRKTHRILRRDSVRVGSAALAIAVAASMTPGYFLGGLDHAVAQPVASAQVSEPYNQIIDADMIASGRVTKAANLTDAQGVGKGLISGHVYLTSPSGNPSSTYANGNVKLDGITVYAQFRDKDGSYSPIFSAKTHTLPDVVAGNGGQGTFAFGTGDRGITWTDKLGTEHTWAARTDQKHRIWVEPFTNERGNQVVMFRQANGFVPGSFNGLVEGPLGSFAAADGNIQQMAAFYQEVPPNHEASWMAAKGDKLVEDPEGPISFAATQTKVPNTVSGRVWLETGGPDKGIVATGPSMNGIDEAADGYTVYASTLTKDGAAANQKLHEQYKDDPAKLAEETKKMLEDHPEYILKTVYGKTDNEGYYALRFGNYEKGQVREDILNPNHVFVWVENKDGVVQNGYTGFHTPIFQRFNAGGNFRASAIPGENQLPIDFNGLPFQKLNSLYNVNYAIMPYTPVTITADYNATDKPAGPGTTVTPELNGDVSTLSSKVEWRDQQGNVLKTCELDQSKGMKAQVTACTFDIPADAKKGDYFNVVLVSGGNDVSAWTVLVTNDADDYTPAYEDKLVVPGQETKSAPSFTDKDGKDVTAPEGSKFAIDGDFTAPEGYVVEIDESTGEITVTFPDGSKLNKDTVEEFDVPVTVTYPDGTTDKTDANFKLDTDGDGDPDVTDPDDDNDGIDDEDDSNPKVPNANDHFEPGYEDGSGKPGSDVKIDAPKFTDKDGNDTKAPEGTKFTPGDNVPNGVTIDENTGEITVTIPEDATPGSKIEVPVVVTYPDGTKDNVDVTVTVEQPDAKDNEKFEPAYEGKLVVPGQETKSVPSFTDKDGKGVDVPEGSKFSIGDYKAPEGYVVTIDENTGEITVTFPDGSKLNKDTVEEFDVPVTVTYKDGSTDEVKANFKLDTDGDGDPDVTDPDDDGDGIPDEDDSNPKVPNQNTIFEPGYEDGSGKPGEDVTIPAPEFKDKDGKTTTPPEGTKFTPGEDTPDGVTIDENTGEITVTIPGDATPGDKITVPVVVTYPDGTKDNVDVTVTVEQPDAKDNEKYEPEYNGGSGEPGTDVTVDKPTFKDGDGNEVTPPEGTTFTPGENVPDGVTIDENTGEITVTIPEDAKPGDKIEVPVVVTYPDGSTDEVTVTITVTEKDATPVTPGEPTERNPSLGASADDPADCEMPPFVTVEKTEGVEYKVTVDGKELTPDAEGKYVYDYGQTVKVEASPAKGFTFPEGVTTTWTYTTAQNEVCNVPETKDNEKYEPEYEDGTGKPGDDVTVDKPIFKDGDGNEVTPPEGTTFTPGEGTPDGVTVNEDGSIKVTIPEDAKPGDKITVPVVVTYPDDSTDTVEVTVTVEQPDTKTPDWKDGSGEPGGKVVIPNDGGPVDDGTTVETDGPGKAEIDDDGNLVVDIDDNAKPGDKIVVIVKDKDGNEIDRVTVTVEKPAAGDKTEKVVQKPKLARTGVQVAGLAGIAAAMGVAGLGLAFMRRRREGEEN